MIAVILGNGKTRTQAKLDKLSKLPNVKIFGCNAIYRDIPDKIDYLVAIDDGMINEIYASDFPKEKVIIPPYHERWEPAECNPRRPRSNAGMNAIQEAIKLGATTIVGIGFDFLYGDKEASVSNIYDGTKNYGPETRASYYDNVPRANYLHFIVTKHQHVNFFFAYPEPSRFLDIKSSNFFYTTLDEIYKNAA